MSDIVDLTGDSDHCVLTQSYSESDEFTCYQPRSIRSTSGLRSSGLECPVVDLVHRGSDAGGVPVQPSESIDDVVDARAVPAEVPGVYMAGGHGRLRPKQGAAKTRNWFFTSFLTDDDQRRPVWDAVEMQYLVYQLERCPESGKLHWQGAVKFKSHLRRSEAQSRMQLPDCHFKPTRDWTSAVRYCKKVETRISGPWEFGKDIDRGFRRDIDEVVTLVKADASLKRIAECCPREYIKFHKGINALRIALQEPPGIDRKCVLLLGDTGVGKTRFVMDNYPGNYNVFDLVKPWFDGYDGQEVVLFDECGEGMLGYNILKQLCDRYPFRVPCKGGSTPWMAKVVFMTSNCTIREWYPKAKDVHIRALERRIKTIHIGMDGNCDEVRDYLGLPRVASVTVDDVLADLHPID